VDEADDDRWRTRTLPATGESPADASRFYLLVLQGDSSEMFHLPATGMVVIGRSDEADLRLADDTASRSHARIITADGVARLVDLGSHNGTFVNGERVDGTRALASGDVVTIGAFTMVLHAARRAPEARPILDAASLRLRLVEEIERATRYQRPMALVDIVLPAGGDPRALAATVAAAIRLIDVVGFVAEAQLAVLMPEAGGEARLYADQLAQLAGGARVGLAICPDDALDADTLLAVARAAAAFARPGEVATAAAAVRELVLGDRTIVLADPALVRLFDLIARLATSDLPILILGETGAGKEGAARAVHHGSKRRQGPFVTVNCAAIPENLVESELFGYEKGAFTGAVAAKAGKLEAASGGTLFLDEIGELPPSAQAKLLRAFEEKRITRLGDVKERAVDLRIVAATNRALEEEVKAGRFRQDLFFRLGAATVVLPPLRDRPREIPILARRFLADACARAGRDVAELSPATLQRLGAYPWPGNVREVRNTMEYVAATAHDCVIEPWHLPDAIAAVESDAAESAPAESDDAAAAPPAKKRAFRPVTEELRELERARMVEALAAAAGVQRRAAELIGMPLRTFVMKLKQYGISPRPKAEP
jgi:two-component system, NtrC family, response regulator AtoC